MKRDLAHLSVLTPSSSSGASTFNNLRTPTRLHPITPGCPTADSRLLRPFQMGLFPPFSNHSSSQASSSPSASSNGTRVHPRTATAAMIHFPHHRRRPSNWISEEDGSANVTNGAGRPDTDDNGTLTAIRQWRIQPGTFVAFELDKDAVLHHIAHGLSDSCRSDSDSEPELSVADSSFLGSDRDADPDLGQGQGPAGSYARGQRQLQAPQVEKLSPLFVGRYLGVVLWSHTYYAPIPNDEGAGDERGSSHESGMVEPVEELVVAFVSSSPPPSPFRHHCIPISPSLSPSQPSLPLNPLSGSRIQPSPLQTSTLFPFSGLYQWTTLGTRLHVRRVYESSLNFALKEDEFARLDEKVAEDFQDWQHQQQCVFVQSDVNVEDLDVERLMVPSHAVPAKVWRDVRVAASVREKGESVDPRRFVREVDQLVSVLTNEA